MTQPGSIPPYAYAQPHQHIKRLKEMLANTAQNSERHILLPWLEAIARGVELLLINQQAVLQSLAIINRKEDVEMTDLTNITSAVANETSVDQSAITLLTSLADQLKAAATDPAAITALADQLTSNASSLAAAVAANTPAATSGTGTTTTPTTPAAPPATPVDTTGTGTTPPPVDPTVPSA